MLVARKSQSGDTIIEVLMAITIFSLIAVGSLMLMQKGAAMAQRSLEITLVRQQMDGQADLIRLAHDSYLSNPDATSGPGAVWRQITTAAQTSGSLPSLNNPATCPTNVPRSFVVTKASAAANGLSLQRFTTARPAASAPPSSGSASRMGSDGSSIMRLRCSLQLATQPPPGA